uniref:uncharacterized protein LOC118145491 n=1 Tax=Callithrix jacchus TaxID=9483 RepID=UPI0004F02DF4|nr:uncharacterized protein LOC118145491 [Callithrix jacchus]
MNKGVNESKLCYYVLGGQAPFFIHLSPLLQDLASYTLPREENQARKRTSPLHPPLEFAALPALGHLVRDLIMDQERQRPRGDQMSFQSSPHTPRTHLILCLVLSAMLLFTFIFLLTLAIRTPY